MTMLVSHTYMQHVLLGIAACRVVHQLAQVIVLVSDSYMQHKLVGIEQLAARMPQPCQPSHPCCKLSNVRCCFKVAA